MQEYDDPLARMGLTLACAVIGQIVSVILSALLASTLAGGYRVRAWAFLALVVWTLAGTVVLVCCRRCAPKAGPMRRSEAD